MVLTKPMLIVAGAVAAALAGLCVILWLRLATVQSDLDTCRTQRAELTGKVELQSQQIEDWQLAAEVAQEKADAAAKRARQATNDAKAKGEELQRQILAGAGTSCDDAMAKVRAGWK